MKHLLNMEREVNELHRIHREARNSTTDIEVQQKLSGIMETLNDIID